MKARAKLHVHVGCATILRVPCVVRQAVIREGKRFAVHTHAVPMEDYKCVLFVFISLRVGLPSALCKQKKTNYQYFYDFFFPCSGCLLTIGDGTSPLNCGALRPCPGRYLYCTLRLCSYVGPTSCSQVSSIGALVQCVLTQNSAYSALILLYIFSVFCVCHPTKKMWRELQL